VRKRKDRTPRIKASISRRKRRGGKKKTFCLLRNGRKRFYDATGRPLAVGDLNERLLTRILEMRVRTKAVALSALLMGKRGIRKSPSSGVGGGISGPSLWKVELT